MDHFSIEFVPGPPPTLGGLDERAAWRDGDDNVCARVYRDQHAHFIDWAPLGLFAIAHGGSSIRAWPYEGSSAEAIAAHARERLQPLVLQTRRYQVLHAAAVEVDGLTVALAGVSGSGKSTLAFALARRGHAQIGDDALVINGGADPPHVLRLPFRPQLCGASVAMSPAPPAAVDGLDATSPLGAIVLLERASSPSGTCMIEPIAGPAACVEVIRHAHVFDEHDRSARSELVDGYAHLIDRVPVFRLTYHPRFEHLARLGDAIETLRLGLRP